jgi:hypothetical protein
MRVPIVLVDLLDTACLDSASRTATGNSRLTTLSQVDAVWTRGQRAQALSGSIPSPETRELQGKPSDGLEPSTPSLPWKCSTS